MTDNPVEVIVAAFNTEDGAEDALKELKRAKSESLIGIQNAAVLRRDEKNKLHVKELKDWSGRKGAAFGGALGAVVGIIGGPAVWAAGATGALIGGLAAKLRDSGFSNERLAVVGEGLKPGTSAIVAVIEHTWVGHLEAALAEHDADMTTAAIAMDIASQLDAGREVAYNVLMAQEGMSANRLSAGEDGMELTSLAASDAGVSASNIVAAEGVIAGESVTLDEEGLSYTMGAAWMEEDDAAEDDKPAA